MTHIRVDPERVAEFCRWWKITEFSLFGSVLREDFRPDSDVDVLVAFAPDARLGWEVWEEMERELEEMFGREVDLVEKKAVTNPFRRHHILNNRQVVYAA